MTICDDLRQSVLQAAIQGKLTKQLPEDGTATDLLASIKAEKEQLIKEKKIKKEKPLAPISEDEIPFDIPESWAWTRLQSVVNIRSASRVHQSDWRTSGIPFYRAREIVKLSKYNSVDNELFVDEELYNKYASSSEVPVAGDLMVSGVGTLGASYIVKETDKFYYKDASVLCFENRFGIFSSFLKMMLESPWLHSQIYAPEAYGTTVATLTMERANQFLIPLPPLAEQHRIVARVDELMAKIDELEAVEKELVALKKAFPGDMKASLLQAAMQGKLTQQLPEDGSAADLLASIKAEKEQLIKEKKIKKEKPLAPISADEIPFDIPDNWEWVKLASIVNFKIGKTPPRSEGIWWKDDIPWVSIADMPENGVLISTKEKISQQALDEKFSGKISPAGSLIMSFKLTVGRVSILGINAVHNEAIVSIFPYVNPNNALRDYLFKLLPFISQYGDSKNAIKGKTLNNDSISNLLIPLPPLAEQQRIVEKLDKLLPLCDALKEDSMA